MERHDATIDWLLAGDAAVQFQTWRDLLDTDRADLQTRIAAEGDAAAILAHGADGRWGSGYYQPKWTSTHYTLLELRDLGIAPDTDVCVAAVVRALEEAKGRDGGIDASTALHRSDVCVNGMFLAFACYFGAEQRALGSVVDFVLGQRMDDGGFNCQSNRSGARVSSVHTTTSVIDGFAEYLRRGYAYRLAEVRSAVDSAVDMLLARRLYQRRSDGEPIRAEFLRLHQPARWHFDILRGLDVLRAAGVVNDPRLDDALRIVIARRRPDGRWAAASQYPGQTHLVYPRAGEPNRWVTLRALRCLRRYRPEALAKRTRDRG